MNKLGTMKQCPKCGMEQFNITYVAPITEERIGAEPIVFQDECMWVECSRCGYIERELPLDAEVKDERNT